MFVMRCASGVSIHFGEVSDMSQFAANTEDGINKMRLSRSYLYYVEELL